MIDRRVYTTRLVLGPLSFVRLTPQGLERVESGEGFQYVPRGPNLFTVAGVGVELQLPKPYLTQSGWWFLPLGRAYASWRGWNREDPVGLGLRAYWWPAAAIGPSFVVAALVGPWAAELGACLRKR